MFEGFSPRAADFLWQLRLNNEKAWFHAHKDAFVKDVQEPTKAFSQAVFDLITTSYPQHGFRCKIARIFKDARRLRSGEGPYRDYLWFSIERPNKERSASPVFWFSLAPETWSYGLGYYQSKPETMSKLRARIARDPKGFEDFIRFLDHQEEFVLDGPDYARKKESPTEKTAMWYNKKSFYLVHSQPNDEALFSPALVSRVANGMLLLMPIHDYLFTLDADPTPGIVI